MAITRGEIAYFAELWGLDLAEEELDHLAPQLDVIITALGRVQEVPTHGILPTSDGLQLISMFRDISANEPPMDEDESFAQASDAARWSAIMPEG